MFKSFVSWLNKKSIIFRWVLSYFVLILFFMLSTGISIGYFYNTFRQETIRTNEYIMDVAGEKFDNIFSDMASVIHGVTDDSMRRLIVTDLKENNSPQYVYSLIQQSLKQIVGNDSNFSNCFLYLEDYDMIIGTDSVINTGLYHSAHFSDTGISYEKWLDIISNDSHNSFMPVGKEGINKFLLVSKNAFSIIYRENKTSLVFVLDQYAMADMNQKIQETSGAYILMTDSGNNVINFSQNHDLNEINPETVYTKSGVSYVKAKNTEYVLTSKRISEGNTLMLVTPKGVFYNKLLSIMLIQVLVLLAIIIISVVLAIVFSKLHFSPVKSMLMALNASDDSGKSGNEYTLISDIISQFQTEKKNMDIRLSRQEMKLKNNFIRGLIRGEEYALASCPESLKNYNIDFKGEKYIVLIFEITDFDEIWTGYSRKEADFETLRFALDNIINELISQKYSCCTINMFDGVACIVNFSDSISETEIQSDLADIYYDVKKHMFEKLGFSFRMVGGGAKDSISEISASYAEAMFCLEYNLVYDKKIMFMDNSQTHSSKELNIFFGKTARLVKLIRQGTQTDIEPAVDEWSRMYMSLIGVFPNIMQYEVSGLVNSVVRELFTLNYDETETKNFAEMITKKYKPDTVRGYLEIKNIILDMSKDIREFIEGNTNTDYLEKRVTDYLEKNYADTDLNVTKIADYLKLNPAYLSSTFKKTANVGILEKINKFRLEKATALLANTNRTVNDVAEAVGYSSVHTFIRIFKKYYYVTPTQYRTEVRRGKDEV